METLEPQDPDSGTMQHRCPKVITDVAVVTNREEISIFRCFSTFKTHI